MKNLKRYSKLSIIFILVLITGCGGKSDKKLESYKSSNEDNDVVVEKSDSKYKYLKDISLEDDGASLTVYIPDKSITRSSLAASGVMSGIGVSASLVSLKESSPADISQTEFVTQKDAISQIEGVSSIEESPNNSNENTSIRQMTYSVNKDEGVYVKVCIIKVDKIQDDYYLKTVIDIDNETASKKTVDILEEIEKAYGFTIS